MERLTWHNGEYWTQVQDVNIGYKNICAKLAAYENTGLEPEEAAELAKAKQDGRLVVMPCKVGDTVWALMQRNAKTDVVKGTVRNVRHYDDNTWWVEFSDIWVDKTFDDFGKTVFLTREDAEKALEDMKHGMD